MNQQGRRAVLVIALAVLALGVGWGAMQSRAPMDDALGPQPRTPINVASLGPQVADRCRQLIDGALRTEPTAANHAAAAEVLSQLGQLADALRHAQQATELDPTSDTLRALLEKLRTGATTTQPTP